jgi:hypothetical protein
MRANITPNTTEIMTALVELLPVSRTPGLGVLMRTEGADGMTSF